jgi:hypothetical protein
MPNGLLARYFQEKGLFADINLAALKEGRGKNCVMAAFPPGELDYFFAYPADYSKQSIEWVNGEFERYPHNPAFEVIYVYSGRFPRLELSQIL